MERWKQYLSYEEEQIVVNKSLEVGQKCRSLENDKQFMCFSFILESYESFKHLVDLVVEEMMSLFSSVWAEGCLPAEWKHAFNALILKPGNLGSVHMDL